MKKYLVFIFLFMYIFLVGFTREPINKPIKDYFKKDTFISPKINIDKFENFYIEKQKTRQKEAIEIASQNCQERNFPPEITAKYIEKAKSTYALDKALSDNWRYLKSLYQSGDSVCNYSNRQEEGFVLLRGDIVIYAYKTTD